MSEKIERCRDRKPCRGLSSLVQQHAGHGGGFKALRIFDLTKPSAPYNILYAVKSRAACRGITLNFCPFCGGKINRRWCHTENRLSSAARGRAK